MAQSLSKILLHAVFSTKNRTKLILSEFENDLHGYIASICRAYKSNAYKVGGTENHIHIAYTLPRTITVAKLMEEIKKSSSKWIKKSPGCSRRLWTGQFYCDKWEKKIRSESLFVTLTATAVTVNVSGPCTAGREFLIFTIKMKM